MAPPHLRRVPAPKGAGRVSSIGLAQSHCHFERIWVKRIVLFECLAKGDRFRPSSDIDLAVEGLKRKDFVRAYADLMLALNWPIDLKPLEEIDGLFREMILKREKIIYER
ncbi:MAG: nucleotidyltransferase family protein [bacterium]